MYNVVNNIDIDYFRFIEKKIINKASVTEDEINYYLSYIVYCVRNKVLDGNKLLDNKCDLVQSMICHYFDDIGVVNYPNMTLRAISDYIVGHSFVIATFNVMGKNINYLIDPTYIQFFSEEKCSLDNFIVYNDIVIKTPAPGYYIKMDDREIINNFNYFGFGKLEDRLAKIYGDSFYNTKTMVTDTDFKEMMGFVYINSFLKGREILSKTKDDLIDEGYYLSFTDKAGKKL